MLKFSYLDPDAVLSSEEFRFVENFLRKTGRTQIGWHYWIDLAWIYAQAKTWPLGTKVLDAGGGHGPTQFLLAEMGHDVTNVDLCISTPPSQYSLRYGTQLEVLPSYTKTQYVDHLMEVYSPGPVRAYLRHTFLARWLKNLKAYYDSYQYERWRLGSDLSGPIGKVRWIKGNLCAMPEIQPGRFDAVVSLSALEHIPLEVLPAALSEIRRVLSSAAQWAVTTSASPTSSTWYHQPSRGLCFSKSDLERYFGATGQGDPVEYLLKYRNNQFLPSNLARLYKKSGDNGMPWGKWDPAYVPVGIRRL